MRYWRRVFWVVLVCLGLLVASYLKAETQEKQGTNEEVQVEAGKDLKIPLEKDFETKKGKVAFPHAKHFLDYDFPCSKCHHQSVEKKGEKTEVKPINLEHIQKMLKEGKSPFQCETCHQGHKEVVKRVHKLCKSCHQEQNKEFGKSAPTKCRECHPRPKKKKMAIEGC